MPNRCKACRSPQRADIDRRLISGETLREIAGITGLSSSAIDRHRQHLPAMASQMRALVSDRVTAIENVAREITEVRVAEITDAIRQAGELTNPAQLAEQVRDLMAKARDVFDRAHAAGRYDTALRALQRIEAQCILLLRMQNAIQPENVTLVGVNTNGATPVDELRRRLDVIAARNADDSTTRREVRALPSVASEPAPRPQPAIVVDDIREAIAERDDVRRRAARFTTIQG